MSFTTPGACPECDMPCVFTLRWDAYGDTWTVNCTFCKEE